VITFAGLVVLAAAVPAQSPVSWPAAAAGIRCTGFAGLGCHVTG
jgi:hypothetical protein